MTTTTTHTENLTVPGVGGAYEKAPVSLPWDKPSDFFGTVSELSGGIALGCALAGPFVVGLGCAAPAAGVALGSGALEAVALHIERNDAAACASGVVAVEAIIPVPSVGRMLDAVFALTRLPATAAGEVCG